MFMLISVFTIYRSPPIVILAAKTFLSFSILIFLPYLSTISTISLPTSSPFLLQRTVRLSVVRLVRCSGSGFVPNPYPNGELGDKNCSILFNFCFQIFCLVSGKLPGSTLESVLEDRCTSFVLDRRCTFMHVSFRFRRDTRAVVSFVLL